MGHQQPELTRACAQAGGHGPWEEVAAASSLQQQEQSRCTVAAAASLQEQEQEQEQEEQQEQEQEEGLEQSNWQQLSAYNSRSRSSMVVAAAVEGGQPAAASEVAGIGRSQQPVRGECVHA